MQKKTLSIQFDQIDDLSEFSEENQELIKETIAFSKQAYAPYSNFQVSACLRLDNGKIIKGANVENGSYPVSICAERTLLSHTVSNYPDNKITSIAIYVDKAVGGPVPPCGLCRQTLTEVELRQKQDIELILIAKEGAYFVFQRTTDLLPLFFDGSVLD
jgi:cytidine deaminase